MDNGQLTNQKDAPGFFTSYDGTNDPNATTAGPNFNLDSTNPNTSWSPAPKAEQILPPDNQEIIPPSEAPSVERSLGSSALDEATSNMPPIQTEDDEKVDIKPVKQSSKPTIEIVNSKENLDDARVRASEEAVKELDKGNVANYYDIIRGAEGLFDENMSTYKDKSFWKPGNDNGKKAA